MRDAGRLAGLAALRSDLSVRDVAVLGVSAWAFRWEPPAGTGQAASPMRLSALDALEGRWPGAEPPLVASASTVVRDRLLLSEAPIGGHAAARTRAGLLPTLLPLGGAGSARQHVAGSGAPAPFPAVPAEEGGDGAPPWSQYVPIGPAPTLTVAEAAQDESTGWVGGAAPAPLIGSATPPPAEEGGLQQVSDDPVAATVDPEFRLSTDPRTRRCQIALSASNPRQVCRTSVDADDNGLAYDDCVRDLEARVAQCAQGR